MRELDALRELRADLPAAGAEETAEARAALLAEIASGRTGAAPARSRRRLRAALAVACCAALLALFLAATPPGRALSEQVGELVGLDAGRPGDFVPAAPSSYLSKFSILSEPIAFDEIPVEQRAMLVSQLPRSAQGAFRIGQVTLPDGTVVKALGNRNVICFFAHPHGGEGGSGNCASLRWAVLHGLLVTTICADGPEAEPPLRLTRADAPSAARRATGSRGSGAGGASW